MKSQNRNGLFDTVVHRWLKVPYKLHVTEFQSPKNPTVTVVFIHGMGDSAESWREVSKLLPLNVRVVGVDMLGFGQSPMPNWVTYDIRTQARSVAHTLVRLKLLQRPILVGHSMGALVAIELAKRFPLVLKRLILCSPPLYKSTSSEWLSYEKILKDFYRLVMKYPGQLEKIAPLAMKLGITTDVFNIKGESAKVYIAALESSIINQSSFEDIQKLNLPITILYGTFDPVVVSSNFKELYKNKNNIRVHKFPVGHEILGKYVEHIAGELKNTLVS